MDIEVQPAKLERLKKSFREEGLDDNMNNYVCLGRQWFNLISGTFEQDKRLMKSIRLGIVKAEDIPAIAPKCPCKQYIEINCLIRHMSGGRILVIGSCCYKALTIKESRKEMCSVVGCNNRHSNRIYTVCNTHKEELKLREREVAKIAKREAKARLARITALGYMTFGFGKTFKFHFIKDIPSWYVDWIKREGIYNPNTEMLLEYVKLKAIQD